MKNTVSKLSISLPFSLEVYARKRVLDGAYSSISEYLRELIRIDQRMQSIGISPERQYPRPSHLPPDRFRDSR